MVCVPSLELHVTEHGGDDVRRLFGIEWRGRVSIRQLGIVGPTRRARDEEPARAENAGRFGDGEPGVVEVVEHPERGDGARAPIAHGQDGRVGADLGVGRIGELGRREIDDDRRPSRREQGLEVTLAAADVEDRREVFAGDPARDGCMDVAEDLSAAIAALPAPGSES
jgi:hypothetical protein